MAKENKGPWHAKMVRIVSIWTIAIHLPWAIALALALVRWLGLLSYGVAMGAVLLAYALLEPLVFYPLPDKPRPAWRVDALERPYFVHVASVHVSAVGWLFNILNLQWKIDLWLGPFVAYFMALWVFGWGSFVTSRRLRIRHLTLSVYGLPAAFEGYRIAHISDIHLGGFTPPSQVANWLERVRAVPVDLTVITGDVVTSGVQFHESIASLLGTLRSPDGVFFVPGNHDYFGNGMPLFELLERHRVRVLRNEQVLLTRNDAPLLIAGMDDVWTGRGDLAVTLSQRHDRCTILLAHDPIVFDDAARLGVSLMLSGHTHGGQLALPGLARHVNLTKRANRYSLGVYRNGRSTLVVSGGLGCTGLPIRVGVPPEVGVITLVCARCTDAPSA
ncbi:MAG: putative metallophosphoesterase [Deltaproteobacteria bacterium ADurb.Bin207]|jgi:hypothetical protein|nr:MAG: putative metallophosphoesterase [Deltaproteobacteria bacterium ADurb.Bin207]